MPESGGASLANKPHFGPKPGGHQGDRKSAGGPSTNAVDSRKKGTVRYVVPYVSQSSN